MAFLFGALFLQKRATSGESAPQETAPSEAALPDLGAATSSMITGILPADIPLPEVTEVSSKSTEPVVKPPEAASKETKEATSSEPINPTVKPTSR